MKIFSSLISALLMASCSQGLEVSTTGVLSPFSIGVNEGKIYKPGETVTLAGSGFTAEQWVDINGAKIPIKWKSKQSIEFVLPDDGSLKTAKGTRSGQITAALNRNNKSVPLNFIYIAEETDYFLWTGDPSNICKEQKFYDGTGELVNGTKECVAVAANCDAK